MEREPQQPSLGEVSVTGEVNPSATVRRPTAGGSSTWAAATDGTAATATTATTASALPTRYGFMV